MPGSGGSSQPTSSPSDGALKRRRQPSPSQQNHDGNIRTRSRGPPASTNEQQAQEKLLQADEGQRNSRSNVKRAKADLIAAMEQGSVAWQGSIFDHELIVKILVDSTSNKLRAGIPLRSTASPVTVSLKAELRLEPLLFFVTGGHTDSLHDAAQGQGSLAEHRTDEVQQISVKYKDFRQGNVYWSNTNGVYGLVARRIHSLPRKTKSNIQADDLRQSYELAGSLFTLVKRDSADARVSRAKLKSIVVEGAARLLNYRAVQKRTPPRPDGAPGQAVGAFVLPPRPPSLPLAGAPSRSNTAQAHPAGLRQRALPAPAPVASGSHLAPSGAAQPGNYAPPPPPPAGQFGGPFPHSLLVPHGRHADGSGAGMIPASVSVQGFPNNHGLAQFPSHLMPTTPNALSAAALSPAGPNSFHNEAGQGGSIPGAGNGGFIQSKQDGSIQPRQETASSHGLLPGGGASAARRASGPGLHISGGQSGEQGGSAISPGSVQQQLFGHRSQHGPAQQRAAQQVQQHHVQQQAHQQQAHQQQRRSDTQQSAIHQPRVLGQGPGQAALGGHGGQVATAPQSHGQQPQAISIAHGAHAQHQYHLQHAHLQQAQQAHPHHQHFQQQPQQQAQQQAQQQPHQHQQQQNQFSHGDQGRLRLPPQHAQHNYSPLPEQQHQTQQGLHHEVSQQQLQQHAQLYQQASTQHGQDQVYTKGWQTPPNAQGGAPQYQPPQPANSAFNGGAIVNSAHGSGQLPWQAQGQVPQMIVQHSNILRANDTLIQMAMQAFKSPDQFAAWQAEWGPRLSSPMFSQTFQACLEMMDPRLHRDFVYPSEGLDHTRPIAELYLESPSRSQLFGGARVVDSNEDCKRLFGCDPKGEVGFMRKRCDSDMLFLLYTLSRLCRSPNFSMCTQGVYRSMEDRRMILRMQLELVHETTSSRVLRVQMQDFSHLYGHILALAPITEIRPPSHLLAAPQYI